MVKQNAAFKKLTPNYLFPALQAKVKAFKKQNPKASLISLGIGDTTEPLPQNVADTMAQKALALATLEGYKGYGPEAGAEELREHIAQVIYHKEISKEDIYISDGAKCAIGWLQLLFGRGHSVAVQNPTYPVYVDSSYLMEQKEVHYLACTPNNHFFPTFQQSDLLFFCSPNNPTGVAATKEELSLLVKKAKKNNTLIIYDAAYAPFIQDERYPRSIYEIEGANEVAIEVSSFSKVVGFTGVRLGWTVVPKALTYLDNTPIYPDWQRVISTVFNGASNVAQAGGIAALSKEGQQEQKRLVNHYLENARLLKETLLALGYTVYGGEQAPYLWVSCGTQSSKEGFEYFLQQAHLITTPGSGFGAEGEGFLRFSAFASRENIQEACKRLKALSTPLYV